jgi:hypothetical protein
MFMRSVGNELHDSLSSHVKRQSNFYIVNAAVNGERTGWRIYRCADNPRPVFTVSAWEWVYAMNLFRLQRETRERERTSKRHVGEAHSVLITAILLPQRPRCYWGKSVTAQAHQSWARRLASDHCATEIHWPKSAILLYLRSLRPYKTSWHLCSFVVNAHHITEELEFPSQYN